MMLVVTKPMWLGFWEEPSGIVYKPIFLHFCLIKNGELESDDGWAGMRMLCSLNNLLLTSGDGSIFGKPKKIGMAVES